MMHRRSPSQVIYRTLLCMYPHEFRARFASDLGADFADLLQARGTMATWLGVLPDLCRSVPVTHARARAARKRARAIAYHGETAMGSLKADVRHAVRALVKAPVFTAVIVVTLALGIGANSAIFSLVNAVLLRPLGYVEPERLMLIYEGFRGSASPKVGVSPPDFVDLTTLQRSSFSSIGAYRTQRYELSGGGEPEQITVPYVPFAEAVDPALALPMAGLVRRMTVAAVSDQDVATLSDRMRAAIATLDPALAVAEITTMAQVIADQSAPQRFTTVLLGAFASGAVLLAAIGLYGMLAFGVVRRTREIGVRLALGATSREVLGLVVRQGMTLTLVGLGLGIAGALGTTRLMRGLLYQTETLDVVTFASVPGILAAVALLACYLPARRAARVEPMAALRAE